jgi:hypothetical protein
MISKGLSWAHSLFLTKLFADQTNFLKFYSQRASQYESEDGVMEIKLDTKLIFGF